MTDDHVSLRECVAAQKACRAEMFDHMDENQKEVMAELKGINRRLDIREGKELAEGTGLNAPVGLKLPKLQTMLKVGLLVGAFIAGSIGGCKGAMLAAKASAEQRP